jgi:hypothetical protein
VRRIAIPPYLTLDEDFLVPQPAEGWEFERDGHESQVIGDRGVLPAWDSELRFVLRRRFLLGGDPNEPLGFGARDAAFRLITRIVTARGLTSTVADDQRLDPARDGPVEILIRPDSRKLSYEIRLLVTLVLYSPGNSAAPLSPRLRGSRLWEDEWAVRIEGGRVRLPFELASFSRTFPAIGHALFHVEVAEYPELEFEQAVCVYLNSDYPAFITAVEKSLPAETALLWDGVIRRVVAAGLGFAFESEAPWPENSIGAQVDAWLSGIFPGQRRTDISRFRVDEPSRFEARIQSWARIVSQLMPLGVIPQ